ncbi:MAG: hypothetical protein Q9163_001474 [Psora crenata]
MSTRFRGKPPLKKRALTPPTPQAPSALTRTPPSQAKPVEEGLPVCLRENQPLPTLPRSQDIGLSTKVFKSTSESSVLATSLERSRQRWMTDSIFDRYWAKPSKKRGTADVPQPAKESMSRLGICSMIIEPHAFEVTLYTVKDIPADYKLPHANGTPSPQSSHYRQNIAPRGGTAAPGQIQHQQRQQSHFTLPPFKSAQIDSQGPKPVYDSSSPTAAPIYRSPKRSKSSTSSQDKILKDSPSSDPVIQMLATRAASDYRLKGLMKIVAAGNASPEQLKDFQVHIDEFNTLLKSPRIQDTPNYPLSTGETTFSQTVGRQPSLYQHTRYQEPAAEPEPPRSRAPLAKNEQIPERFPAASQPTVDKLVHSKPNIHSIVFDFGGQGDRFFFPRLSILEYLHGGTQVIVSFLVIRRGSMAVSGKYKDTKTYYQPVTMRLSSHHPRTLETLSRMVAPPDEVRKYMDDVFNNMCPAEEVYLPLRLPRSKELEGADKTDGVAQCEGALIPSIFPPPTSIVPLAA